jgi:predicted nuclease of predicted toxin-antitoxin system
MKRLRSNGIEIVHVAEIGMATASDPEIFAWAITEGRMVVTRNDQDFAPLVSTHVLKGISFPGVLFIATSIHAADTEHHVRSLLAWIEASERAGRNPIEGTYGWLR